MTTEEFVRWFATINGVIAAIAVAGNFGRRVTGIGFVVFTLSSMPCFGMSRRSGDFVFARRAAPRQTRKLVETTRCLHDFQKAEGAMAQRVPGAIMRRHR